MNAYEKLAVLTALKKAVDTRIKQVRAEANEELIDSFEREGIEKKALMINGRKVGTFTVNVKDDFEITDREAFEDFALAQGFAEEVSSIAPDAIYEATEYLKREMPEWVRTEVKVSDEWKKFAEAVGDVVVIADTEFVIPGVRYVPPHWTKTTVRDCKPKDVIPLLTMESVDTLLLGSGDE